MFWDTSSILQVEFTATWRQVLQAGRAGPTLGRPTIRASVWGCMYGYMYALVD